MGAMIRKSENKQKQGYFVSDTIKNGYSWVVSWVVSEVIVQFHQKTERHIE
jgi:hypothetical protein